MAFDKRLARHALARKVMIHVGRIEIGEAPLDKSVHHPFDLTHIHRTVVLGLDERKTHHSESQFPGHVYLRIKRLIKSHPPRI